MVSMFTNDYLSIYFMENYSYPRSFKVRNKPPNRSLKNITETKKNAKKLQTRRF